MDSIEQVRLKNPQKLAEAIKDISITIGCGASDAVLVGGQSVLFWAEELEIEVDPSIQLLTEDVDFIASIPDICDAEIAISHRFKNSLIIAGMDESAPNSGKMSVEYPHLCKINVDFLRVITGLGTSQVRESAFPIKLKLENGSEVTIRIISPIDLLISKISNLGAHLNKRCREGIAQAEMTMKIVNKYLTRLSTESVLHGKKLPYSHFEKVIQVAHGDPALFVYHRYGIDVLKAIPVESIDPSDPFITKRMPVVLNQINIKREKFERMVVRMEEYGSKTQSSRFHP